MNKVAVYKITFTPSGPYFFGNENTFKYQKAKSKEDNPYYIRSENTPSQSTVFGSLRYILLPEKGLDKLKLEHNIAAIGESGFNMDNTTIQAFGLIKRMSAVFISKGDELFIPTPFDHKKSDEITEYTPFQKYDGLITTDKSEKLYTEEYDAKEGISESFMSIKDNQICNDLISVEVRVGINRNNTKDGFFKKEYKYLKAGYSFCVFAEIGGDDLEKVNIQTVSMGQGKVPFAVKFEKIDKEIKDVYDIVESAINKKPIENYKRFYCLSDMVVGCALYDNAKFAIVQTREHRSFKRDAGKYTKSQVLHRLVKAGSVFLVDNNIEEIDFAQNTISQKNSYTIGYNQIITIKNN